jgi:hypothetical protein
MDFDPAVARKNLARFWALRAQFGMERGGNHAYFSRSMGEMLLEEIDARSDRELLVLCGHTHGAGVYRPQSNVEVRTCDADYAGPKETS